MLQDDFSALITQNQDIIHKVCNVYCPHPQEREDLFQEIVYQLWKSYSTFRGEAKFTTWMYRVALNTAITSFKKFKKQPISREINERILEYPEQKDELLDEKLKSLYEAIAQLSEIEKAVIMLHLDEHSYQDISKIMGITESNVGVKINRIKKKLKEILQQKEKLWN